MSTTDFLRPFEADLDPETLFPRVRFNFDNGWSASLVIRTSLERTVAMQASVAASPAGRWGSGLTELGPTEADADEAIAWIDEIRRRPPFTAAQVAAA